MIEFPVLYTFKAMGDNNDEFVNKIREIFNGKKIDSLTETKSKNGNYVSISITVEIQDYEELTCSYTAIKSVHGLKYHL